MINLIKNSVEQEGGTTNHPLPPHTQMLYQTGLSVRAFGYHNNYSQHDLTCPASTTNTFLSSLGFRLNKKKVKHIERECE